MTETTTLNINSKAKAAKNPDPLKVAAGSDHEDFNVAILTQVVRSSYSSEDGTNMNNSIQQGAVQAMMGFAPEDELEGMLAAQMIACHNAAMDCFKLAATPEQTFDGRELNLNHGTKLTRTYAQLLLALDKHRGKGQQKVTVEHVHVYKGGQAIVGNVETGGGGKPKIQPQPHTKPVTHAPEPEMRCEMQKDREPVPITGNA